MLVETHHRLKQVDFDNSSVWCILARTLADKNYELGSSKGFFNPLAHNDIYIYMLYRTANLQRLHLLNKYTY